MDWLFKIIPDMHLAGQQSLSGGKNWFDPRRVIYDHELMCFADANRHFIEFDDQTFELGRNSFIIIPPGVWHSGRSKKASGQIYRTWVHFSWLPRMRSPKLPILTYAPAPAITKHVCKAPAFIPTAILHGKINDPVAFFEKHRQLCRLYETPGMKARLQERALLLDTLACLLIPETKPLHSGQKKVQAADIHQTLQQIAEHPFAEAPLLKNCLHEQFGLSYEHLCRIFKQKYDTTPLSYIHAIRIDKARLALLTSEKTVAEIAKDLGFNDPIYFHRLFKQHTGLPPGQFRQKMNPDKHSLSIGIDGTETNCLN